MSTPTINTLQDTINKRAAKRLDADLVDICNFVRGNRLLQRNDDKFPKLTFQMAPKQDQKRETKTQSPYWVFQYQASGRENFASSVYMDDLRAYWLPIYIEEETKAFMDKIDEIRNDVDGLLDREEA